jgi:hypothetical protein
MGAGEPGDCQADDLHGEDAGVIEFGGLDEDTFDGGGTVVADHDARPPRTGDARDPWSGPDVELVFDASGDPFEEFFEQERQAVERFLVRGPDDFSGCRHVASREGDAMARKLEAVERIELPSVSTGAPAEPSAVAAAPEFDDADMVVIEEDLQEPPVGDRPAVVAVRPGDYRSLFARLRRGR